MQMKQQDSLGLAIASYLALPLFQAKVLHQGYEWFVLRYTNMPIDYWHLAGITYILVFLKSSYKFSDDSGCLGGNTALRHVAYKYVMTILAFTLAWVISIT